VSPEPGAVVAPETPPELISPLPKQRRDAKPKESQKK